MHNLNTTTTHISIDEINNMSDEIKKYFKVGNWNYYIMKKKHKNQLIYL